MQNLHFERPGAPTVCLDAFLLADEPRLGLAQARPAVVVCPGGGYVYHSAREAEPVALAFAARGFHAFVLRYSVGRQAAGFAPLADLDWALGLVRAHAAEWSLAPQQVAVCGFSAGGHLALAGGLLGEQRPDALVLGYPAVDMQPLPDAMGGDIMLRLLTSGPEGPAPTGADRAALDLAARVTAAAPPMFLYGTSEDFLHAGFVRLLAAYDAHGLPYEAHIFQYGPHGMGLCTAETANGGADLMDARNAQWQPLCVGWLRRVFGGLQFNAVHTGELGKRVEALLAETP